MVETHSVLKSMQILHFIHLNVKYSLSDIIRDIRFYRVIFNSQLLHSNINLMTHVDFHNIVNSASRSESIHFILSMGDEPIFFFLI